MFHFKNSFPGENSTIVKKKNFLYLLLEVNVTLSFFNFRKSRGFWFFSPKVGHNKFVYGCKSKIGDRTIIKHDEGLLFLSEMIFPAVCYEVFVSASQLRSSEFSIISIISHDVDLRRNSGLRKIIYARANELDNRWRRDVDVEKSSVLWISLIFRRRSMRGNFYSRINHRYTLRFFSFFCILMSQHYIVHYFWNSISGVRLSWIKKKLFQHRTHIYV